MVDDEKIFHLNMDQMTSAYYDSDRAQGRILRLSEQQSHLFFPKLIIRRMGKGSSFKNGYSLDFLL